MSCFPFTKMIPYSPIGDTQEIRCSETRICKEVVAICEGEIVLSSICPQPRVGRRSFPSREDIDELEIERTSCQNVLGTIPLAITIPGSIVRTSAHRDVRSINSTNTIGAESVKLVAGELGSAGWCSGVGHTDIMRVEPALATTEDRYYPAKTTVMRTMSAESIARRQATHNEIVSFDR